MNEDDGAKKPARKPMAERSLIRQNAIARNRATRTGRVAKFDIRILRVIRAGYVTANAVPDLADYAVELAAQSGRPQDECLRHLRMLVKAEDWPGRRIRHWERVEQRALEREQRYTLAVFERRMGRIASDMLDDAEDALAHIPVTSTAEAVMLAKLGMEMGYRALRAPASVRDFYDEDGRVAQPPIEATYQEMPRDDYAAATEADLAALAPEVGTGPPAGGDHA